MDNYENEFEEEYLFPGEVNSPIWNDLHEFFQDSDDDFFEA